MGRLIAHLSRTRTIAYCATGVLAAGGGITAAHLVAGLINPAASLVLAVSSTVIDATRRLSRSMPSEIGGKGAELMPDATPRSRRQAMTYYRIRRPSGYAGDQVANVWSVARPC